MEGGVWVVGPLKQGQGPPVMYEILYICLVSRG
jgi:hypothetical protein